ncbi:Mut7-C ubiquitin/RNAse domain-containing protein [Pontibacter ruber]|uniref:Mut7-C ubiquitin/RNAse domain-containing protein n=1 Tax=Pontibacter ruber TaxID=1343895 RepID=A0ABW5CSK7_9BACT|nr:Mut7-C ubiquitin/RNAse domain-containing protein [Pontibacter ruber]
MMKQTASFRFFGALNDFLRPYQKEVWITYHFDGTPAVKDAIEAIGVPHPEVQKIRINEEVAAFYTRLHPDDRVEVYPAESGKKQPVKPADATFILDVHLGKLARGMRMLGFDTTYENSFSDKTIVEIAVTENRIVLTRDVDLLKNKAIERGYWLRSQHAEEQLTEVIRYFGLAGKLRPFARCIVCNGSIAAVPKEEVWDVLPPKTKLYFDEFFKCTSCSRVYWKGSHYEHMLQFIERMEQQQ